MIHHYLLIAWRNLWKNKVFSIINLLGLAIGLSCCLLMTLYIRHELSYDDFQKKGDRVVRVIMEYSFSGAVNKGNYTSTKVAPSFKKNFPEVESGVRMTNHTSVVKIGSKLFNEDKFAFADSTFFDLFSFRLLKGNSRYALSGPNKVLLTASTAKRYFGNEDPINRTIKVGSDETDYLITGIIEDCPSNSQIKYDLLASFSSLGENQEETYYNANYTTYLLLRDKASIESLQRKIPSFMKKEMVKDLTGNDYVTFWLEPFKRIHLHSEYAGFESNNNILYIYIVSGVALLMLIIACFTYINLSTARSLERAKEVGVRKVSGATRNQLFWQFISESLIITVIALLISYLAVLIILPAFDKLTDRELKAVSLFSPFMLGLSILIIFCISLFAGSYPAIILSSFQPVKVLKGAFKNSFSGLWLRRSIIVFQFVISVFLIIATFIIQNQLHFIQTKDLGFDRSHILVVPIDPKIRKNISTIKTVFKSNPNIQNISLAYNDPTNIIGGYNMRREDMPEGTQIMVTANPVDDEFIKTTGIHIITGEDFTRQDVKDVLEASNEKAVKYHYILNEAAARELGWDPENAIGKKMYLGNQRPGIVKAVVKNFHFSTMHNPIKPMILYNEEWTNTMLIKISGNAIPNTISFLQSKWKELISHRPFDYHFLDDDYNKLYDSEMKLGKSLNIFTVIAILLACMGLFGLSAYAIQQRTKEIGIRKVLGASISNVVFLLSRDFVRLVILSMIIAFPFAGWLMNRWLEDYAYRINISWWMFAIAGFAAIMITLLTISFQSIKAALSNPVKSLRTE